MKKLSRDEMKKVMGGGDAPGDDGIVICKQDSDCASGYVCRARASDGVKRCVKGFAGEP